MALLLIALLAMGLTIVKLPDVGFDTRKIVLILAHKQLGLAAAALAALRLAWRVGNVLPSLVRTLPDWQKVTALTVHYAFYALMFALPVSGWLMSSAAGFPVSAFGLVVLPDLVPHDALMYRALAAAHRWLSYALIACLVAHAAAALVHHLLFKDETLQKMWPQARR